MRPPSFWNISHGRDAAIFIRTLLMPLAWLYDFATQSRIKNGEYLDIGIPIISIGNISLGGTGKTPLSRVLAHEFGKTRKVAVVSRGYGGEITAPTKVDFEKHNAVQIGDEPLMLAKDIDVFIGKNRTDAALLAKNNGTELIILDDGHQNPALLKTASIIVIDGSVGFGNGHIFPAGPLREKPNIGLKRGDLVVWIGTKDKLAECNIPKNTPIFFSKIAPVKKNYEGKYIAFCGIGRPEKFHDSLKESGIDIIDLIPFPDHHYFSKSELENLKERAHAENAKLITTEKDYSRIDTDFGKDIEVLEINIEFEDKSGFFETLNTILQKNCAPK